MTVLSVAGVTKRFGGRRALERVTLEAERGTPLCLLGHNGAGKSTLLRLIAGLSYPSEGEVRVLGGDPSREPGIRRRIGYLSESPKLYDKLTVEEHLRLHAALYGFSGERASARGGALLRELALDPTTRAEDLSLGTRKKLALALALVHEPELLVLDEPTSGLDQDSARVVGRLIRRHAAGSGAVVLSTHSIEFAAAFAHEILVLREGRVAAWGVREESGSYPGAG